MSLYASNSEPNEHLDRRPRIGDVVTCLANIVSDLENRFVMRIGHPLDLQNVEHYSHLARLINFEATVRQYPVDRSAPFDYFKNPPLFTDRDLAHFLVAEYMKGAMVLPPKVDRSDFIYVLWGDVSFNPPRSSAERRLNLLNTLAENVGTESLSELIDAHRDLHRKIVFAHDVALGYERKPGSLVTRLHRDLDFAFSESFTDPLYQFREVSQEDRQPGQSAVDYLREALTSRLRYFEKTLSIRASAYRD